MLYKIWTHTRVPNNPTSHTHSYTHSYTQRHTLIHTKTHSGFVAAWQDNIFMQCEELLANSLHTHTHTHTHAPTQMSRTIWIPESRDERALANIEEVFIPLYRWARGLIPPSPSQNILSGVMDLLSHNLHDNTLPIRPAHTAAIAARERDIIFIIIEP